jgi:hypothetical protein
MPRVALTSGIPNSGLAEYPLNLLKSRLSFLHAKNKQTSKRLVIKCILFLIFITLKISVTIYEAKLIN